MRKVLNEQRYNTYIKHIQIDCSIFDYIVELHDYLWRVVRSQFPWASGTLDDYLDITIEALEHRKEGKNETSP